MGTPAQRSSSGHSNHGSRRGRRGRRGRRRHGRLVRPVVVTVDFGLVLLGLCLLHCQTGGGSAPRASSRPVQLTAAHAVWRAETSAAVRETLAATVHATIAARALRRPVVWVERRAPTDVAAQALRALAAVRLELGLHPLATAILAEHVTTEPAVSGRALWRFSVVENFCVRAGWRWACGVAKSSFAGPGGVSEMSCGAWQSLGNLIPRRVDRPAWADVRLKPRTRTPRSNRGGRGGAWRLIASTTSHE